ncbi:enoyl-CoA hydratase [Halobacteriales archaeon QS_5_70_17]|nr:MAG: enoyl-CoA hydratase [Halobacteriales archaeon QS_5_70_17]
MGSSDASAIDYDLRAESETAWITIDRPEKRNALDLEGWRALRGAVDRASEEARVAVLAGAGDAFCAGDDIATVAGLESEADVRALADCLHDGLYGVERAPVPVVAAVDGPAYGGGFELVAAADLAVATDRAAFALPETTIGAYPPYAADRIGAICGRKRLMELALTGDPVDAATAREWGLVNRVVDEGDLAGAVADLVDRILDAPAPATRLAKAAVARSLADGGERDRIAGGFARVATSEDCRDAARAFLDG